MAHGEFYKALIIKVQYTSDFFVGMLSIYYQMMVWAKNKIGYAQIFEKIGFFNFPCYFPFNMGYSFLIHQLLYQSCITILTTKYCIFAN